MKSKALTWTAAQLNANSGIILATALSVTSGQTPFISVNGTNSYPRIMIIDNQSGKNITFALLANTDEAAEMLTTPANYAPLTVRHGTTFTMNPCPAASGICITGVNSGTATSNLTVWFGGYSY